MQAFLAFIMENLDRLLEQTIEHTGLTFLAVFLAVLLAVPAGIAASRFPRLASPMLGLAGVLQTIPSIALLGFLLPLLGIGVKPAIVALFLYALLPILRNTFEGIKGVDPAVTEAAAGMGMTNWQQLLRVELPLAMPVIFAGIRTATVINVGVATLAAYIGAGGLGEFIFGGIALNNSSMILAGAIPAALLAILFDQLLALLQKLKRRQLRRSLGWLGIILPVLTLLTMLPRWTDDRWDAGFDPEFMGREDGYDHLMEIYGLDFNTAIMNASLMYEALREGAVDVIGGYSTDGRIKAFDLQVLTDDRRAFPPYQCAPLVGPRIVDTPELLAAVDMLANRIDDAAMTALNYQVDYRQRSPAEVAREFLEKEGLWRPNRQEGGATITIGSKIFTEQYILAELYGQLIDGYTDYDVELVKGLGGTKICFDALRLGDIDLYPEYTGTGLLVILQTDPDTADRVASDIDDTYQYVRSAFQQAYGLTWLQPLGFNNTYALMVTSSLAREEGLERVSDLK